VNPTSALRDWSSLEGKLG